jgi:hypothetical protein
MPLLASLNPMYCRKNASRSGLDREEPGTVAATKLNNAAAPITLRIMVARVI